MPSPDRGEVWLVEPGARREGPPWPGHQRSSRPTGSGLDDARGTHDEPPGLAVEVAVPLRFLKSGGFDAQNLVTPPHAKLVRKLGDLSATEVALVEAAVRSWLSF